jgi:carbonic anhydrase
VEIISRPGFGEVFVNRVAGNVVTAEEIASLGVWNARSGAKVLVVLGHSGRGAVKAALEGAEVPGQISALYRLIRSGNRPQEQGPRRCDREQRAHTGQGPSQGVRPSLRAYSRMEVEAGGRGL